jgi:photosystem II oxygen-evolving enhancer protein 2
MLKRILALLLVVVSLSLSGCVTAVDGLGGLKSYVDSIDGYEFLYPNGWVNVRVEDGPDVVLHDLIETTENVSVVISPVPNGQKLTDLGSPGEVGYKLGKNAIAPAGSGREAELVTADEHQVGDKTYYILEYAVKIGNQQRHNLASVAVSRGKLFTLNVSTTEARWEKVHDILEKAANSFTVY